MIATHVFLPTANPTRAAVVVLTAAVVFPAARLTGLSAYISSKLALIKLIEFLAAENPTIFAAALHPGMIDTNILRSSGADPSTLPLDSGKQQSMIHSRRSNHPDLYLSSGPPSRIHGLAHQPRRLIPKRSLCMGELGCGRAQDQSIPNSIRIALDFWDVRLAISLDLIRHRLLQAGQKQSDSAVLICSCQQDECFKLQPCLQVSCHSACSID